MKCKKCKQSESKVIDSRLIKDGEAIRRRRECTSCNYRYTTYEYIESVELMVQKNDGTVVEYDRAKLKNSIKIACKKRPSIDHEKIEKMVDEIYYKLTEKSADIVKTSAIGKLVMTTLKKVDEVAYIRFASVYRKFKDVDEFMNELEKMKSGFLKK